MLNIDIYIQEYTYLILKNLLTLTQLNGQTTYEEEYEKDHEENYQNIIYDDEEQKTDVKTLIK